MPSYIEIDIDKILVILKVISPEIYRYRSRVESDVFNPVVS
jgi:hypothetical protein